MNPLRQRLSVLVAALWWGGTATLAFVAVPTLFAHFGNPAVAGPAAAKLFTVVAWLVVVCGLALLLLGRPLLVGVSRKSMIGQTLNRPVSERLYGSLALAALAMNKGARILRVHDVAQTVDVVRMIAAVECAD